MALVVALRSFQTHSGKFSRLLLIDRLSCYSPTVGKDLWSQEKTFVSALLHRNFRVGDLAKDPAAKGSFTRSTTPSRIHNSAVPCTRVPSLPQGWLQYLFPAADAVVPANQRTFLRRSACGLRPEGVDRKLNYGASTGLGQASLWQ